MSALGWALLVIITCLLLAAIVFIVVRILIARNYVSPRPAQGPHYSHEPKWFEYYRTPTRHGPSEAKSRSGNLPRCSSCGAATAFDQDRCHKCGNSLKPDRT